MTAFSPQSTLQSQAGDAEVRVLIGEFQISRVVCRFRDAPRHPKLLRHIPSAAARRAGWSARAGSRPARASPATASGTRTSSPTTRSAPSRDPPASSRVQGETSGGPAHRPWRSRRSSPAAPRRRAGRSSWDRDCRRRRGSRSKIDGARGSNRKSNFIASNISPATAASAVSRRSSARAASAERVECGCRSDRFARANRRSCRSCRS